MKKITLLLISMLLGGVFAFAKIPPKKLRLISATSQEYLGGAAGSPSGIRYEFTFLSLASSEELVLDRLWIGEDYYEIKPYNKRTGTSTFSKKDTLVVVVKKVNPNTSYQQIETQVDQTQMPPFPAKQYSGEGVFSYLFRKKRAYLCIPKFSVLKREERI